MPSIICRRGLDEERGNPWLCGCPFCVEAKKVSREEELKEQIDRFEQEAQHEPTQSV
jgi:hypothetical protein